MKNQYTTGELAERLEKHLGCPCACYAPSGSPNPLISDFWQARAQGKKEGFVPM
ncbi:MAG: hypothetical protein HFF39_11815, partial [Lawsonibacter sp.]|nr:hypothetical protein [Lawsonibacter sp.]